MQELGIYLISAIPLDDSAAETIITNLATFLEHILGDYVSVVHVKWRRMRIEQEKRNRKCDFQSTSCCSKLCFIILLISIFFFHGGNIFFVALEKVFEMVFIYNLEYLYISTVRATSANKL